MCSSRRATRCMHSASSGSSVSVGVLYIVIAMTCSAGSLAPAARRGLKTALYTAEAAACRAGSLDPAARCDLDTAPDTAEEGSRTVRAMTLAEALPVLHAVGERVPEELRVPQLTESIWSKWVARRDADIRSRLDKGDEDSVVNLMLYGTTFTRHPRATPDDLATSERTRVDAVMEGRLIDLVTAIESPGRDERLQFARQVVERHGGIVGPRLRGETRKYLEALRSRVLAENQRYANRLSPGALASDAERRESSATVYRDRGLSSDTSLRVNFALEQALIALRDRRELRRPAINRIAVIGPGLDFLDKAQGYDFYPVQVIQPFAIADSLLRLGLATRPAVTAFDISPRILAHLRSMREHATHNQPYRLNLVLERDTRTTQSEPALTEYWERFGAQIGAPMPTELPPAFAARVRARAIAVRPQVVLDVGGRDLDVVVGRVAGPSADDAFDAIVATNVLVYYDPFEQALAVANMANMLARGGVLLTNQPVPGPGAAGLSATLIAAVDFDRVVTSTGSHQRGDSMYAYTKK